MSDARFNRLEEKVDKVDDKVERINLELVEMKLEFKAQNTLLKEHVAGDNKIVSVLAPLIPQLREMTEDYAFQKQKNKEIRQKARDRMKQYKKYGLCLGALSAGLSIIGAIVKFFNFI